MKKLITVLLAGLISSGSLFALEDRIEIFGEIKSGFLFEQRDALGKTTSFTRIHNNDGDSGAEEGRIRMGMAISILNFGLRTQFYQNTFKRKTGVNDQNMLKVNTDFAYAYGNIFNSQLKISAGLLGESPWGTGGPELNQELESTGNAPLMGIRVEYKPNYIRGLNIGFVLNRANENIPNDVKQEFGDLFNESIVGIAWDHQYFGLRFAYHFDRDVKGPAALATGEELAYRVEERVLWNLLPGFQISANGYYEGISSKSTGGLSKPPYIHNWFYVRYDPMDFTAGIDVGYKDYFEDRIGQILEIRPSFYYKFINNYLIAGIRAGIVMGFNGQKSWEDVFYNEWYFEPQVKFNIHYNFYTALVYRYTSTAYQTPGNNDYFRQWLNLRLCFTF